MSGLLGDRFDRCYIVAAGCLLWGVMTAAVGLAQNLPQAMVSCACGCRSAVTLLPAPCSLPFCAASLGGRDAGTSNN